jgi:flavin-dependent dehydrogenase
LTLLAPEKSPAGRVSGGSDAASGPAGALPSPADALPGLAACDVLVMGGGPAGSTAAILLAEKGYRVVLVEKARHPRFHIGESLLPANLPLFERLGVAEPVRCIGMQKWGAEFISPFDGRHQEFEFGDAWDKSLPFAYQVRRSAFDEILIRRAAEVGAEVIEGCRVREVQFLDGDRSARVEALHEDGRTECWDARHLVDATGRDTFLANRLEAKHRNKKHNSAAMYAHFTGARRECGKREGNICIYWFDHGWFWFIPLSDGATSVGAVVWPNYMKTRKVGLDDFFRSTIALCPPLAGRLADATLVSPVEATGNYSYACDHTHGANYLLAGDAYAFIDPVFSTGVMLAMTTGAAAADTIDECRRHPERAARAMKRYDRLVRLGPKQFSWFIYRVTNPAMRELFLAPRNLWRMKEALLSVLAGDIFRRTPIWKSLQAFKGIYYAASLANLGRSWRAARRRAFNMRPVETESSSGG